MKLRLAALRPCASCERLRHACLRRARLTTGRHDAQELQALEAWTLHGRIAVAAGEDGFSGGFDWSQQGATADIELSGPMGGKRWTSASKATSPSSPRAATTTRRGRSKSSTSTSGPGQSLPVKEMRYWLVGAPAPGIPHEEIARRRPAARKPCSVRLAGSLRPLPAGRLARAAGADGNDDRGLRLRVAVSDWRLSP